jgi:hypothetical protein
VSSSSASVATAREKEKISASMLADNPALTWKYLAQIGMAVQGATMA